MESENPRIQSLMVAEIKKQPFKATLEQMQRYRNLNSGHRRIPENARYYFVDVNSGQKLSDVLRFEKNADGVYVPTSDKKLVRRLENSFESLVISSTISILWLNSISGVTKIRDWLITSLPCTTNNRNGIPSTTTNYQSKNIED